MNQEEKKRKVMGLVITVVFHAIIITLLCAFGLKYPDPPPPEYGVEIDTGILEDTGQAMTGTVGGSQAANTIHNTASTQEDNTVTQDTEEVDISANQTEEIVESTPEPAKVEPEPKKEEKINPMALFKKGKVKKQGSGEGEGKGDSKGEGDGGAMGTGTDLSGKGAAVSLPNRTTKSLGMPPSKTDDVGSIVVTIWVNQEGKVTRAVAGARGTTIDNKSLWKHCENAARKSQFSKNDDAPEEQKGTITYKFVG